MMMNICKFNCQGFHLIIPRRILESAISNEGVWGHGYALPYDNCCWASDSDIGVKMEDEENEEKMGSNEMRLDW